MARQLPPTLGLSLTFLRAFKGWTQTDLAKASGTVTSQLSQYENGKTRLTQERFDDLAAAMATGDGVSEFVVAMVSLLRSMAGGDAEALPGDLTLRERQGVNTLVLRLLRAVSEVLFEHAVERVQVQRSEAARYEADDLWQALADLTVAERRVLIEQGLAFQTWAMCLRLCDESAVAAASRSAAEALHLAELAVRVAQLARGGAGGMLRLQGYARAFAGNAHRVAGKLPEADARFAEANRLWDEGEPPADFSLPHWRLLELEASLRWTQQDWPAAVALLARASQAAPAQQAGSLLVNEASALRAAGQIEAALAALDAAAPQVADQPEPRWLVQYNQIACLCRLGRYSAAAERLRRMGATDGGNTLSLVRHLWLQARVAAGRGERRQAIDVLERVRTDFMLCCNSYEAALVSVELAILYMQQGQGAEVRRLARSTFEAFQVQRVGREARVVIVRFCRMAETDSISLDRLYLIHQDLERARLPLELASVLEPLEQAEEVN